MGSVALDFRPPLVGREEELGKLVRLLADASAAKGRFMLLAGEAGVGKTRLVEELKRVAESRGFAVLSGYALHESLTPYMPFTEALRTGGLEHLLAEAAPRVEAVYLFTHTGLLVKEAVREETRLDPDIFASMLATVGQFAEESLTLLAGRSPRSALERIGMGEYVIVIAQGGAASISAIVKGTENEFLLDEMPGVLTSVDRRYGPVLQGWDGDEQRVSGVEAMIEPLITSGKYDGVALGYGDPKSRRDLLFEGVVLGLARRAESQPTLLCIEDLQWSDPSTLALLQYLARNARNHRIAVLGTYRPEDLQSEGDRPHHLVEAMGRLDREGLCERMEVRGLSEGETAGLVTSALRTAHLDPGFCRSVHEETEGNPLFVLELVKLMVDEGTLRPENGSWALTGTGGPTQVPLRVKGVVGRRLSRLRDEEREVLDVASACGEEFASEVLAPATGLERIQLLRMLFLLERKHRLVYARGAKHRFGHVKIRETLYDELPAELRKEYHGAIVRAMEAVFTDRLDELAGDLAFHHLRSPNPRNALPHLLKAAERASKAYANQEAIRFYTEALDLEDDPERKLDLVGRLLSVFGLVGEYGKIKALCESAFELADTPVRKAQLRRNIGAALEAKGEYEQAMQLCTGALGEVEGTGSKEEGAVLYLIGDIQMKTGRYDDALNAYERALTIREAVGDRGGTADCYNHIGGVFWRKAKFADALRMVRKSLEMRENLGQQAWVAGCQNNIGLIYQYMGDYENAISQYRGALAASERTGHLNFVADVLTNMGTVHHDRGEYASAIECYERALTIRRKLGDLREIAGCGNNIGRVERARGDYGKALQSLSRSLEISERIGALDHAIEELTNMGFVYSSMGNYENALQCHRKGLNMNEQVGDTKALPDSYLGMAEVYMLKGDVQEAERWCDRALALSKELQFRSKIADSKSLLAQVYREQERWEEGIRNFEESITELGEMGRLHDLSRAHYEFGRLWKRRGDVTKARLHLETAMEIFEELQLPLEMDKARSALEEVGT